jgi:hypothetical protein
MQYISWSHLGFLDDHDQFDLSADPLFRLSSGVRGVLAEAIPNLSGSDNPFLTASLYSPKGAITSAIVQRGLDPRAYVRQFMALWDDPAYGPVHSGNDAETSPEQFVSPLGCPKPPCRSHSQTQASLHPQHSSDPRRTAFERIAERLSLLLCLVAMSGVTDEHSPSEDLVRLRPEIERCFLTFPVLYSRVFRGRALQDDPRAPVTLYHFYRAARILLDSPTAWWAGQRSRVFESRILRELQSRGLCMCVSVELGQSTLIQAG